MINLLRKMFKWKRDNNYYGGLILLQIGIITIVPYLLWDAFEPLAFMVTFMICGWGFVLLWKSDNDYRFRIIQQKMIQLTREIQPPEMAIAPSGVTNPHSPVNQRSTRFQRRKLALSKGCF